jgi:ABC-type branched-subunit amino acid transport system ATPase component/branched-subunit amino acid ABC-type transport system permease component
MLPFIIAGLTTGSAYALAGVGLVLTYKTSGIFNFAHGALAAVSAYMFYALHVQHGMPWVPAAVICVLVVGPLLGTALEWIARALSGASLAIRVVSTIGILLLVQGIAVIVYGDSQTRVVPQYLPTTTYHIGSTAVTLAQIIVAVVGVVATFALYVFFRVTRLGLAMQAVVDDPALLDAAGTRPVAVRRWAWVIGVVFASASGLLLVPFITLDATTLTFLVVAAFGAAALAQFKSLPGTYFGGLAIGIGAALATKYFTTGLLDGLSASLPFIVLFVVLMVSPRRRLADRAPVVALRHAAWTAPWQVRTLSGGALAVLLLLVPSFAGFHLADWSQFLALCVLFLSLGLLVRTSGQVSLCHVSFMAIGVCAFSDLTVQHGWPWGFALVAAGLITVPVGALLAIPAIRLPGLYLALATFGFGILVQFMFYSQSYMFGNLGLGVTVPMPQVAALGLTQSDKSYYYLCLLIAAVVTAFVFAVERSRLGRLLRALSDSPTGLAANGTSVNLTHLLVFCISAFLAAVAGVMQAGAIGTATDASYEPITSLVYFALIIIAVGGAPWYAVGAGAGTTIIASYWTDPNANNWLQVLFGLTALVYSVTPASAKGTPPALWALLDRMFPRKPRELRGTAATAPHRQGPGGEGLESGEGLASKVPAGALDVDGIRVVFGGLVAIESATLHAPTGRITGLIGPNGAGKTTLFNTCSGFIRPNHGKVVLNGSNVSRHGPASRARRGLGRTFQQMELFDTLTVRENVALGLEAGYAGWNLLRHLSSSRATNRRVAAATEAALRECDLLALADRTPGSLSTGQRRLVELARCLAGPFRILLLDEPSSGLDRVETARFGEILRDVVARRGVGILLVEHDMALVTDVCEHIYVLDFGKQIFEGSAAEVMSSPIVRAAYLGDEGVPGSVPDGLVEDPDTAEVVK